MSPSEIFWGGVALIIMGFLAYMHHEAYKAGAADCYMNQVVAQDKEDKKVQSDYAEIDKKTPFNATDDAVDKWVRQYTVDR